ncbi:MAG: DUF4474 domain-containing protein [Oscillospiraceae bacterium]|jgi:hypothetical protein|nr:DUF4474 domain-containing protein [Oscillospiraceae bacterium]
MKRFVALLLCSLLLVSVFAACTGGKEENTTVPLPSTAPSTAEGEPPFAPVSIPEGFIHFATAQKDESGADVITVRGLYVLQNVLGQSVTVSDQDVLTADYGDDGKIIDVTVLGNTIRVVEAQEQGTDVRTLYAKQGNSDELPSVSSGISPAPSLGSSSGKTSTKAPAPVKVPGKVSTTTAPKKSADQQLIDSEKNKINSSSMTAEEKRLAISFMNYKMDQNGIWYVDHQPWQKQFGFNAIYDVAAPLIQLVYATFRVKFRYDYVYKVYQQDDPNGKYKKGDVVRDLTGKPVYELDEKGQKIPKDWMIQAWKGRYGAVMLGGEIGVYTKAANQTTEHYYSAIKEEELVMAMDCYHYNPMNNKIQKLFTRGPESAWWLTGFVTGSFYQYNNKKEIILVADLNFNGHDGMLEAFEPPFAAIGFSKGSPSQTNVETYTIVGTHLKFAWQYIDVDA